MRIDIIGADGYYSYDLPESIEGNYWIYDDISNAKIFNVDAVDNQWNLRCAENVKLLDISAAVSSVTLRENNYYNVDILGEKKVIFTTSSTNNNWQLYKKINENDLTVGASKTCDIVFQNKYILEEHLKISFKENKWLINTINNSLVFMDGKKVFYSGQNVNNGCIIYVFGLKILLLNNQKLLISPSNCVNLGSNSLAIENLKPDLFDTRIMNQGYNNRQLYSDNSYFFSPPRLRRFVETFKLTIDPPPEKIQDQEIPMLFVIGPMLGTGMYSMVNLANSLLKISNGESTFKAQWTTIVVGVAMMGTTVIWPNLTKFWQKKQNNKKVKLREKKYSDYIQLKQKSIDEEYQRQKQILLENFSSIEKCKEIIINKEIQLWERNISQQDFLTICLGNGSIPLDVEIDWKEKDFVFEDDKLKSEVSKLISDRKILTDVPIGYSFIDNNITAIMNGGVNKRILIDNIILQLITFHSYKDLKLVTITNTFGATYFDYLKITPHSFSDSKDMRFFAKNDDDIKEITNYLNNIFTQRLELCSEDNKNDLEIPTPYYLIITDCFENIRNNQLINNILNQDKNLGFGLILLEDRLSKLPSACNNFINIGDKDSTILHSDKVSYENQSFKNNFQLCPDMYDLCAKLSNIPIEFEKSNASLPDALTFLEMFDVGKVEQLNSLNRWKTNNPVKSLKAEIGINDLNENVYLDLHEKYHGPHGLVAGMTGSGKSEFIITYVLSMAVNYSPNEVAFVLIDYKGGGLAGAFDNKGSGLRLPHLAGTITNLDKSEMNRSLASIDSELRRRQSMFNDARNKLGESTIDIYKYQQFFREGKLDEPIPHLIIICDEFAELKTQQPEFMENLISTARIGRSLGVHLILATQKPSGVVDSQIWSNTKFRVCLKVQDKSDSNEMLKRPDAAELKQVGRFYLQVGYNEMFLMGQSGYAGAKYFPSDSTKKEVDKSLNIIDDIGNIIYSVDNDAKEQLVTCEGEQLANTLTYICNLAKKENLYAKRLWLDTIPPKIYINNLIAKYKFNFSPYNIVTILGEYDNPKNQIQDIYTLDLMSDGNSIIYGVNGSDKEMIISSILYSTCALHTSEELNYYIIDYGSEALRLFNNLAQVGDMVFAGEDEKTNNLFKLIDNEIDSRKKLFIDYSGSYTSYIKNSGNKIPLIVVIINEVDAFFETNDDYNEIIAKFSRDGQRYGIIFILTANSVNAVRSKIKQNFSNIICMQMNSSDDYTSILGRIKGVSMSEIAGRGLMKKDDIYEFQTGSICEQEMLVDFMKKFVSLQVQNKYTKAPRIPILPDIVNSNTFVKTNLSVSNIPIGISKLNLNVKYYDFSSSVSTFISGNDIKLLVPFVNELLSLLKSIPNTYIIGIDINSILLNNKNKFNYYFNQKLDLVFDKLMVFANKLNSNCTETYICILTNVGKLNSKVDEKKLEKFVEAVSKYDKFYFLIVDDDKEIKKINYENWFRPIWNDSQGIWIGNGVMDQNVIKVTTLSREMRNKINNNFAWVIKNNSGILIKSLSDGSIGDNDE